MGWNIFPEGIYHALIELKKYNVPVFVSEAGIADEKDIYRAEYIEGLAYWIHQAISDGVDVRGYLYWSLTDNFEWALGYSKRFGLIAINYETKERTIRDSAYTLQKIAQSNMLEVVTNKHL
jgi:beta-galactosidase